MEIKYPELEATLKGFVVGLQRHGLKQDHALFHSLYTFGFRIQELSKCETWVMTKGKEIVCYPSKKSKKRLISAKKAHPLLVESVEKKRNFLYLSSYSTYRRLFEARISKNGFVLGGKKLSTHIFRHLVAKRLDNQGITPKEIQNYLGLKNLNVALGYIHSQIKYAKY